MTRRRFYASPKAFTSDCKGVRLDRDEARHLRGVLRLDVGDTVYVFDGTGREFRCEIADTGRDTAMLAVREEIAPQSPESKLELTLAVALLKGEKFDLVVQKATELGVARIVPVMTKRADVKIDRVKRTTHRDERWARLALEAAKQSGRARVPEVAAPVELKELFARQDAGRALLFAERGGESLEGALDSLPVEPRTLTALVGPEGGWETSEIEAARGHGWRIVTLGGRTLRAETAAIAVATLLQHRRGDIV
jgi:16S rRNA (uracil1498-N3)-methyltransferase